MHRIIFNYPFNLPQKDKKGYFILKVKGKDLLKGKKIVKIEDVTDEDLINKVLICTNENGEEEIVNIDE